MYEILSSVYDDLNSHVDYNMFADFYEKAFKRFNRPVQLIADLGCGSGTLTEIMAGRGYDMIGIDVSEDMLMQAINKRSASSGDTLYLCQDMCEFELYGAVGAIVCTLDGINHLLSKDDVVRCFKNCLLYLDPGGMLIFDVITPYNYKMIMDGTTAVYDTPDTFCAVNHVYDKKEDLFYYDMSIFRRTVDKTYERFDDYIVERPYGLDELREMLFKCGFERVYLYDDFKFRKPGDECKRAVFIAIKEK